MPHFVALTHPVICVSSAFIFQTFAVVCYSVFVNRLCSVLNFRKAYIFKSLLKVYYRFVFMNLPKHSSFKSVLKVYTLSKILLWIKLSYFSLEMRGTPGTCIKPGCLARRPLCHEVNLPASCEAQRQLCHKANLCHRVNLPSCVARRPLFHEVNLPRCEARRQHDV